MTKRAAKEPEQPLRDPSDAERVRIEASRAWVVNELTTKRVPPEFAVTTKASGTIALGPPHSDHLGWQDRLCHALGSASPAFCDRVMNQLASGPGVTAETMVRAVSEGLAFIARSEPASELETLLLLQAWTTHTVAMVQHRRVASAEMVPQLEAHGALAVKMGNLFTRQIDALAKLRGGGKQQVEVRHVYINGNAVIGNVTAGGAGGADAANARQAHAAALAYAPAEPVAPLWGQDAIGLAMQGAGREGEAPLQDARLCARERCAERLAERPLHDGPADEGNDRGPPPGSPIDDGDDGAAGRQLSRGSGR